MGLQSACPVLQGNPFSVNVDFCAFGELMVSLKMAVDLLCARLDSG